MVVVTVVNMGGSVVWGPSDLPLAERMSDLKTRVLCDQADPHCHIRFFAGLDAPSDRTTVQELAGSNETLLLTAVQEYRLTDQERKDYKQKLQVKLTAEGHQTLQIFQQFPASARADPVVVLEAIRRDWRAIQYATGSCNKDKEFMRAAIKVNRRALSFASEDLKTDRELVLEAVTLNGYALQFADPSLSEDPCFMKEAVRRNGSALEYADQSLKANKEIVLTAVKDSGMALAYANSTMRQDEQVATAAVSQTGHALQHVDLALQTNKNLVLAAVRQTGDAFKHVLYLQNDPDVTRAAAAAGGARWRF